MTAREALAQFDWSQDQAGIPVEETGWLAAAVYEQLLVSRAAIILEDKRISPSEYAKWSEQTIGCVQLEEVPTEECPCEPPSGCKWFRTVVEVPQPVDDYKMVTGIGGNLEQLKIYTYEDWYAIQFRLNARLEAERERSYYTKKNKRLYVIDKGQGAPLSITGSFYDPVEVQRFNGCGSVDECKPFLDYDIYIDSADLNRILGGAVKNIVGMRSVAQYDDTNNANPPLGIEPIKP